MAVLPKLFPLIPPFYNTIFCIPLSQICSLKSIKFQKNSGYHSGIKQSPFKALFGCDAQVGLRSVSLPSEILERLVSEDDLMAAYQQSDPSQVSSGNQTPVSPNLPTQEDTSPDPSEATSSTSSSAPSSQETAIQIRHDTFNSTAREQLKDS